MSELNLWVREPAFQKKLRKIETKIMRSMGVVTIVDTRHSASNYLNFNLFAPQPSTSLLFPIFDLYGLVRQKR